MNYFLRSLFWVILSVYAAIMQANAQETATLRIPEALDVLFVDGEKYSQTMFRSGDLVLNLTEGSHTVVLQYNEIFSAGDEMDKVKSRPFAASLTISDKAQLQLVLPAIQNAIQAKAYVKMPSLVVKQGEQEQQLPLSFALEHKETLHYAAKENQTSLELHTKQSDAAQQLRYWWLKATPAEQQVFLNDVR